MILYYAMGGGLGHLTRAFAIIRRSEFLMSSARILTSATFAELTLSNAPCPVDIVRIRETVTALSYYRIISDYISKHHFTAMILDTFPFGIAGELCHVATDLPRIMVCRHLKWAQYLERTGKSEGPYPSACLLLEEMVTDQNNNLARYGDLTFLCMPVADDETSINLNISTAGWLVVHSGGADEQKQLLDFTHKLQSDLGCSGEKIQTIFPDQGIYPAADFISSAKHVVSGGGYNMISAAALAPKERIHHLFPFPRRFDDQQLRIQRLRSGTWCKQKKNGAEEAAKWAEKALRGLSPSQEF